MASESNEEPAKPKSSTKSKRVASRRKMRPHRPNRGTEWSPSERQLAMYAAVIRADRMNREIAKEFGVHESLVTRTVKQVNAWLVPQYADDIRGIKAKHTKHLEHIFSEAMAAWEASKLPGVTVTNELDELGRKTRKAQTKYQTGNPAFLSEARAALDEIRKIWGADAPQKVEHSGELRVAGMSLDEANQQLADELQSVLQQITTPAMN